MVLVLRLCASLVLRQGMNKQKIVTWMFALRQRLPILFLLANLKEFPPVRLTRAELKIGGRRESQSPKAPNIGRCHG